MSSDNRIDKVTTKRGDGGKTSLADGTRYDKYHPRIELVGELDELNGALGLAYQKLEGDIQEDIAGIQSRLFDFGAAVATGKPQDFWSREAQQITLRTSTLNAALSPLQEFILPGGSEAAARMHVARSLTRRTERRFWALDDKLLIEAEMGTYLNRLSDYLFVAARSVSSTEVQWQPLRQ